MKNISVLVSGGGTNLQAVIDNVENGFIENAKIVQVIASKEDAYALTRAKNHNIKGIYIGKKNYPVMSERTDAIIRALDEEKTDLVILAGYMSVLEPKLIEAYRNKITSIHPSLIPKYCGKGFYGHFVHEAVIAGGETESGATVHFVDEGVDTGKDTHSGEGSGSAGRYAGYTICTGAGGRAQNSAAGRKKILQRRVGTSVG